MALLKAVLILSVIGGNYALVAIGQATYDQVAPVITVFLVTVNAHLFIKGKNESND